MDANDTQTTLLVGVSQHFGRALAYFCLQSGHNVVISSRNEKKLASIEAELKPYGKIGHVAADASSLEDCENLFKDATEMFGRINNVAVLVGGFVNDNPEVPTGLDLMIRNHVQIPSNIISAASKYLHGGASIVLISSTQVFQLSGTVPHSYTIAKTALNRLVETSASFFIRKGIRINAVAPSEIMGSFEIGRTWKDLRKMGDSVTPPEDIAQVIMWLFSEGSQWVTGTVIPVDGGFRFLRK